MIKAFFQNPGRVYTIILAAKKEIVMILKISKILGKYIFKNMLTNKKEKSIMELQKRN